MSWDRLELRDQGKVLGTTEIKGGGEEEEEEEEEGFMS